MTTPRKQAGGNGRPAAAALAVVLAAAAALRLLLGGGYGMWWAGPRNRDTTNTPSISSLSKAAATAAAAAGKAPPPLGACSGWGAAAPLADRCMAKLGPFVPAFDCCTGPGYTCQPCSEPVLAALRCISPRHMLLRPAPGCSATLAPQPPQTLPLPATLDLQREGKSVDSSGSNSSSSGGGANNSGSGSSSGVGAAESGSSSSSGGDGAANSGRCRLSSAALFAGKWVPTSSIPWAAARTGLPGALFLPTHTSPGGTCFARRGPLEGAEVPRCLRAAGFGGRPRVVISGDSTVRHLFTRLVSMLRQQSVVVDGGGMVHGHYSWQVWSGAGGASAGASPDFVTDTLWYSPTANHIQGSWNQSLMQEGLSHLLGLRAPMSQQAASSSTRSGSAGSAGSGSNSSSSTAAGAATDSSGDGGGSGAGSTAADSGGGGGTALTVDFMVGSRSDWQQRHLRRYAAAKLGTVEEQQRTLMVLSLCVWEDTHVWPKGWLEFVQDMRSRVRQVILLTCPTDRLRPPEKAKALAVVAERNRLLRLMVDASRGGSRVSPEEGGIAGEGGGAEASGSAKTGGVGAGSSDSSSSEGGGASGARGSGDSSGVGSSGGSGRDNSGSANGGSSSAGGGGGGENGGSSSSSGDGEGGLPPLMLLDIDALTQHVPPRAVISPEDFHYQCYLSSNTKYQRGTLEWAGGDGSPGLHYPAMRYDHLRVPASGACRDPVNFAAWQLLLSMLC